MSLSIQQHMYKRVNIFKIKITIQHLTFVYCMKLLLRRFWITVHDIPNTNVLTHLLV